MTLPLWRLLHPKWQKQPFSGEGSRRFGGRWNMKGWPTLYLATTPVTATAEYYQDLVRPGMLIPYEVRAQLIADLTNDRHQPVDDRVRVALAADWYIISRIEGQVPPGWALAQELIAGGAEGALVPSAQNKGGVNLVLWRWHDAGGEGEGASLALLDPERALAGR